MKIEDFEDFCAKVLDKYIEDILAFDNESGYNCVEIEFE